MLIAACGVAVGSDPGRVNTTAEPASVSAVGPGVSIEDAKSADHGEPVLVNGFLYIDAEGNVTLTSLFAESLPPQPGGELLEVEGLDPGDYEFSSSQGIRWTDHLVQVLGVIEDGKLVVSPTISG